MEAPVRSATSHLNQEPDSHDQEEPMQGRSTLRLNQDIGKGARFQCNRDVTTFFNDFLNCCWSVHFIGPFLDLGLRGFLPRIEGPVLVAVERKARTNFQNVMHHFFASASRPFLEMQK